MNDSLPKQIIVKLLKRRPVFVSSVFVYKTIPSEAGYARVAFAFSRHVGPAVKRNLFRRRLREFVRQHRQILPAQDILCIARSSLASLTRDAWYKEFNCFKKWISELSQSNRSCATLVL